MSDNKANGAPEGQKGETRSAQQSDLTDAQRYAVLEYLRKLESDREEISNKRTIKWVTIFGGGGILILASAFG
jgi:hypothetical protein